LLLGTLRGYGQQGRTGLFGTLAPAEQESFEQARSGGREILGSRFGFRCAGEQQDGAACLVISCS
jgi:hypothetical protein